MTQYQVPAIDINNPAYNLALMFIGISAMIIYYTWIQFKLKQSDKRRVNKDES